MQASFPRGGNSTNITSTKRSREDDSKDVLFGNKRLKRIEVKPMKVSNKKKKKIGSTGKSNGRSIGLNTLSNLSFGSPSSIRPESIERIEKLTGKNFTVGSLAMGFVLQAYKTHLLISLPGGVVGVVEMEEFSDHFHRLLTDEQSFPRPTKNDYSLLDNVTLWQPVRCYILGSNNDSDTTKKSIIQLSMRSSYINKGLALKHLSEGFVLSGCVSSVEDHGYIIHTGISSIICFLPNKNVPSNISTLQLGQIIDCVVKEVDAISRTVTVRINRKSISESIIHSTSFPLMAIHPGMLFNGIIDSVLETGIVVNFLGSFYGTIDIYSLVRPMSIKDMKEKYQKGDVLTCRVVFVDHATKLIRFSLRPHVISYRAPKELPQLGDVLDSFAVAVVNKLDGLLLTPKDCPLQSLKVDNKTSEDEMIEPKRQTRKEQQEEKKREAETNESIIGAIIPRRKLINPVSNEPIDKTTMIHKLYKVGNIIPSVRVIGYYLVEGYVTSSNLLNLIDQTQIIHLSNIQLGQSYQAKIKEINDQGLIVMINNRLEGFCPILHTSDVGVTHTSNPSKKLQKQYKIGQQITVKAWEIHNNSLVVTCKKSIINESDDFLLKSVDEATSGKSYIGVVSKISDVDGIRVHFCNGLKGYIPISILSKQGVFDLSSAYSIGQTIKCYLIHKINASESKRGKLVLALDIGDITKLIEEYDKNIHVSVPDVINEDEDDVNEPVKPTNDSDPDQITKPSKQLQYPYEFVSGYIIKTDESEFHLRLDDGRIGILPRHHCYDFLPTIDKLASISHPIGTRIDRGLVLYHNKLAVYLTTKPLFLRTAQSISISSHHELYDDCLIPSSINDLSVGRIIIGCILKVEDYGILIKFRHRLTGLVPRSNITDTKFISSPLGMFQIGESIRCAVQRIDYDKERVILTLKSMFVLSSTKEYNYLQSYRYEEYLIAQQVLKLSEIKVIPPNWKEYKLSTVIQAKISALKDYGIIFIGMDDITIMVASYPHHTNGLNNQNINQSDLHIGKIVSVRVLDIDYENNMLHVSMATDLVEVSPIKTKKKNKKLIENNRDPLTIGMRVEGKIQLIQDKYVIVSINHPWDGYSHRLIYVMITDYHMPYHTTSQSNHKIHDTINVKIENLPSDTSMIHEPSYPHQCLVIGSLVTAQLENQLKQTQYIRNEDRLLSQENLKVDYRKLVIGSIMVWQIDSINPKEIQLKPVIKNHSLNEFRDITVKMHVSNAIDQMCSDSINTFQLTETNNDDIQRSLHPSHPFYPYRCGNQIQCRILKVSIISSNQKNDYMENDADDEEEENDENVNNDTNRPIKDSLIIYVSAVTDHRKSSSTESMSSENDKSKRSNNNHHWKSLIQWKGAGKVILHHVYPGAITKIEKVYCHVSISPYVTGRLNYMDVSTSETIIQQFQQSCYLGQKIIVQVKDINMKTRSVSFNRRVIESLLTSIEYQENPLNLIQNNDIGLKLQNTDIKYKIGDEINGIVDLRPIYTVNAPSIMIQLPNLTVGRICITELCDPKHWEYQNFSQWNQNQDKIEIYSMKKTKKGNQNKIVKTINHGDMIRCRIIDLPKINHHNTRVIELTIRPSKLNDNQTIMNNEEAFPSIGDIVKGFVTNMSSKGCFIRLSRQLTGHCLMKDLSDGFIPNPSEVYPIGSLVTCRVLNIDPNENRIQLTMKQSAISNNNHDDVTREISNLTVNSIVTGTVHKVTEFGVFVAIENTNIIGLSRIVDAISFKSSKLHDHDLRKVYNVGDLVQAKILSVNIETKKVSLGLKPSYFVNIIGDDDDVDNNVAIEDNVEVMNVDEENQGNNDLNVEFDQNETVNNAEEQRNIIDYRDHEDDDTIPLVDTNDQSFDSFNEDDVKPIKTKKKRKTTLVETNDTVNSEVIAKKPKLSIPSIASNSYIEWDDFGPSNQNISTHNTQNDDIDDNEEEEVDEEHSHGRRTRQKLSKQRQEEENIRRREEQLSNNDYIPQTKNDFERLLLSQPNSSYLWIQYMTFYLQTADYNQARNVAEKALQAINFREEDEKFNIWMAWINLEYKFGTPETIETVFKRAINESKGKYIHLNLAKSFENEGNYELCDEILLKGLKKYKYSKKMWMAIQHSKLKQRKDSEAKEYLSRSIQSLDKHKHIEVIMQFALLEYELESIEQGRYLFEELIQTYPKRFDIWNVYVDREIKSKQFAYARQLFERIIGSKGSIKNMKTIFKKYLQFEINYGNEQSQRLVKEMAKKYVDQLA